MNKKLMEAISLALSSPPDEPFFGNCEDAKITIAKWVFIGESPSSEITPQDTYISLRIMAFLLNQTGIMYQEMGATVPLNHITIEEHLMLCEWKNYFTDRKITER